LIWIKAFLRTCRTAIKEPQHVTRTYVESGEGGS
jgi:hypothetical protein